jgi:hypothetical protein
MGLNATDECGIVVLRQQITTQLSACHFRWKRERRTMVVAWSQL